MFQNAVVLAMIRCRKTGTVLQEENSNKELEDYRITGKAEEPSEIAPTRLSATSPPLPPRAQKPAAAAQGQYVLGNL